MTATIYVIRHGNACFGSRDYDRLSDTGRRQSILLGDYFKSMAIRFDRVLTGTHRRQQQTAELVLGRIHDAGEDPPPGIDITGEFDEFDSDAVLAEQSSHLLREDPSLKGDLDGIHTDPEAFKRVFSAAMERYVHKDRGPTSGNRLQAFIERVHSGIGRICETTAGPARVAVFTSGGTSAAIMQLALGLTEHRTIALAWQIVNTSVSTFFCENRELVLHQFNSTAHLDRAGGPELITYL